MLYTFLLLRMEAFKTKAVLLNRRGTWQDVKDRAMNTIGKMTGDMPVTKWKQTILAAEHSPIRALEFTICLTDLPYWVSVHLVRHKIGVEHFVQSQRTDRTGVPREKLPQDAPVIHTMIINAQALITISRKRLCSQAAPETREAWMKVLECIRFIEPELYEACVPECLYRGRCVEFHPCPYFKMINNATLTSKESKNNNE